MSAALQSLMPNSPAPHTNRRQGWGVVSFMLIGGGAAAGFVALSSLMIHLLPTVDAWLVSAVCYGGFIIPVYLLHRRFTFASDVAHSRAMPRYILVQLMALVLASLFGLVFHGTLALPSLPAAILVIVLTSGVNFLVLKGWAFAFEGRLEAVPA